VTLRAHAAAATNGACQGFLDLLPSCGVLLTSCSPAIRDKRCASRPRLRRAVYRRVLLISYSPAIRGIAARPRRRRDKPRTPGVS